MPRIAILVPILLALSLTASAQIKVLIVDGQHNHVVWPKSTIMMKQYLEDTGLFTVDIARSAFTWNGNEEADYLPLAGVGITENLPKPETDPNFSPDFAAYDVVVSSFGWQAAPWPEATQENFEDFVRKGGGFVSVHAADNSFPDWPAYNQMIGLGGWADRDETNGPYVYYDNAGQLVRDTTPGRAGIHGAQHGFPVTVRDADHPITRGKPVQLINDDEAAAAARRCRYTQNRRPTPTPSGVVPAYS